MEMRRPLIVDIARGRTEDGPGLRSVVFFKGCPLGCIFCQNPETQAAEAEVAFYPEKCIGCGYCVDACPESAVILDLPGRIDRKKCTRCGACAVACPGDGLRLIGRYYPVEELAGLLIRDKGFFVTSGGGVTLSGGECTMYPDYIEPLLLLLKEEGIHIAIQTSGFFDYAVFERKILPHLDLIYFDIKFADPRVHRQYTSASNDCILDNLRRLVKAAGPMINPRIPLIPGITTTRENLKGIVEFLDQSGAAGVSLLPYNPLGLEMAPAIGRQAPELPKGFMKPEEEKKLHDLFSGIIEERRTHDSSSPSL